MELREEASVKFSGGSDSTPAAALGAERFEKVHLLTFLHTGMRKTERTGVQIERLRKKYGHDKFVEHRADFGDTLKRVYFEGYLANMFKYGASLSGYFCPACQLAMDVEAIVYNLNRGVRYLFDGQQREKELWPMQMEEVLNELGEFYAEFGLTRESPVYDIARTDMVLYEKGLTDKADVKYRALLRDNPSAAYEESERLSYEVNCYGGTIPNIFFCGYYIPVWGQKRHEGKALRFYRDRFGIMRKLIKEKLGKPEP